MSSLIVSHDLRLMMLEISVENLYVPWTTIFDKAISKRTTVMFRLLDDEWTALVPHRKDHYVYRGSNAETENFHGGRSVVFSVPEASLEKPIADVDLQLHVRKEISKHLEAEPCKTIGFALISVDHLLNGIIKELSERKDLDCYLSKEYKRRPVARSTRGVYTLLDEELKPTEATISIYIRISYLGACVVTEMESSGCIRKAFYAREETVDRYPYQLREVSDEQLQTGCWGSATILPVPVDREALVCRCAEFAQQEGADVRSMKKRKRRRRGDADKFAAEKAAHRLKLLEMLRLAKGRRGGATTGIVDRSKICPPPTTCTTVCPPCVPCPLPCPLPCPMPCLPICPPSMCSPTSPCL